MKETKKFDKWIGILSISVICIVAIVFVLVVSDTHLAKGTYGTTQISHTECTCSKGEIGKLNGVDHCLGVGDSKQCTKIGEGYVNNCATWENQQYQCNRVSQKTSNNYKKCTRGSETKYCSLSDGTCTPLVAQSYTCDFTTEDSYECISYVDFGSPDCTESPVCVYGWFMSPDESSTATVSKHQEGKSDGTGCPCPGNSWTNSSLGNTCSQSIIKTSTQLKFLMSGMTDCPTGWNITGGYCVKGVAGEVKTTGCYSCNSGIRYLTAGSTFPESCNTSAVSGYSPDGNSGYCSRTVTPSSGASGGASGVAPDPSGVVYVYFSNAEGTETKKTCKTGTDGKLDSNCISSLSGICGSWSTSYCPNHTCDSNNTQTLAYSTSGLANVKFTVATRFYCFAGSSVHPGNPSTTPTNSSTSSVKPNSSSVKPSSVSSKSESTVPSNPKTGTTGIIIAWIIGLFAIGYSFWYFKRTSTN